MSLLKSLNSGVSGLKAFQTKMDVIGNNIANVETAGFKSSRVSFAEMMNENLGRSGGNDNSPQLKNQVGLGVRVASIDRDYSQGTMQSTGKTTDLAIEGEGFFLVKDGSEQLMTRAGNFVFNKEGLLVDQAGRTVQGYAADQDGNVLGGGTSSSVQVDFENVLPPKQTENVTLAGNLNAKTSTSQVLQAQSGFTTGGSSASDDTEINDLSQTSDPLVGGASTIDFNITQNDGTAAVYTYNYNANDTLEDMITSINTQLTADGQGTLSIVDGMMMLRSSELGESELDITSIDVNGGGSINMPNFQVTEAGQSNSQTLSTTVYDDLGYAHSLLVDFTQTDSNEWEYNARFLDGEVMQAGGTGTVSFDEMGVLTSENLLTLTFDPGNGASSTSFNVELGNSDAGTLFTQYAGSNSAKVVGQDGYTQGQLIDVAITGEGQVEGVYDNGNSKVLAQLALGQVQNQNGLEMIAGGLFRATSAAGELFVNTASNFSGTSISSGSLESSNVDLAQEFTAMITSQRAYQSSARVITTSDEMLTEAVNLKR